MLRQIIAFVFLLAFAMQTFSRAIVVFDYTLNTKAYARNCENKARPKLHCNGKCQMMKKLKGEERKDQQNPDRKAENKNEVVSLLPPISQDIAYVHLPEKQIYAAVQGEKERKISHTVFHPPSAA